MPLFMVPSLKNKKKKNKKYAKRKNKYKQKSTCASLFIIYKRQILIVTKHIETIYTYIFFLAFKKRD